MSSDLPVALTVAGSDSGGGAGVQADLAAMAARGVHGTSALTAVTAQNTAGVGASEVLGPDLVTDQIRAVFADFDVQAAKTGMLGDADIVAAAVEAFSAVDCPLVVDPVVVAESGDRLLSPEGVAAVREELLPLATLVTPNVPEAELLANAEVDGPVAARLAGRRLCELGADAALVTGGHFRGDPVDVLVVSDGAGTRAVGDAGEGEDDGDGVRIETFRSRRVPDANTHGSGCTLSAAVAAELAKGAPVAEAAARATDHVERAIRRGRSVGRGTGPVDHLAPTKARAGTVAACEAVREVVRTFEREDISRLVPEVGTNVAVAPAYAVDPADVVAVAGRLHRVPGGVRATGGVYPGASSHVARFLLGVRQASDRVAASDTPHESVGAACNVRADEETVAAVRERLETAAVDRADEPEDAPGTMDWVASEAMEGRVSPPGAVVDRGAVGKEPMIRLLAADAEALAVTVLELDAALA